MEKCGGEKEVRMTKSKTEHQCVQVKRKHWRANDAIMYVWLWVMGLAGVAFARAHLPARLHSL